MFGVVHGMQLHISSDLTVIDCTSDFIRHFKKPLKDLVGKTVDEISTQEGFPFTVVKSLTKTTERAVKEFTHGDQTWNCTLSRLKEGGFIVSFTDTTQSKYSEETVTNLKLYKLLMDTIQDHAIFMVDPNGIIKTWNEGARRNNGYTADEIIGKSFKIFYTAQDLLADKPQQELQHALKTGLSEYEYWRVRKDGSRFWCYVRMSPMYDNDNNLLGFVKLIRDLTDKRSVADLKESGRLKSQFFASMSHEIRTPMNGVISAATLLSQTDLNVEQYDLMTIIIQSSQILLKVINDILDFTKMESNEVKLFNEEFDLFNELSKITNNFELSSKEGVNFTKYIDSSVPRYVQGDPFRYRQVLTNLIDNAVKYTEKGSIHVKLSALLDDNEETVVIKTEVIDTGVGIGEEERDKLFQPFMQTDATVRKRFKGTGLGLSICKYLTNMMKGNIRVDTNASGGSSFSFTVVFLVSDESHVKDAMKRKTPLQLPPAYPDAQILLVDDNLINVNVALRILKKLGYHQIDAAYNGQMAIDKLNEKKYDLILMDLEMPIKDGIQATKEIRKSNETVPIIAMTANAMEGDADKCLAAGMNDYLQKPIDFCLLSIALNRWVYGAF